MPTTLLESVSVFFPCFNEEKNIVPLISKFTKILPDISSKYEIIIINDGSTDNTRSVVEKIADKHEYVRIISHPSNLGYGDSIKSGIKHSRYKWVFYTDGDGQFKASDLKKFVPHTQQYSAIIGYRHTRADSQIRVLNARLFKIFVDLLYRVHVKDIDCAYKLFRADIIKSLPLISSGAMISTEILYRLKKKGIKFKQIPVDHYPRVHGQPTGNNPKVIIKAGIESFTLYTRLKFRHK